MSAEKMELKRSWEALVKVVEITLSYLRFYIFYVLESILQAILLSLQLWKVEL